MQAEITLRQAAQQALEALERGETKLRWAAITALRAALAEPEQEPTIKWDASAPVLLNNGRLKQYPDGSIGVGTPAEPEQEPVAWRYEAATAIFESGEYGGWQRQISEKEPCAPENSIRNLQPLYTHLPQHKPLTDEEIDAVTIEQWGEMKGYPLAAHRAFARAIERAHGIGGEA